MNKRTYVPLLFIAIVVLLVGIQFSKDNKTEPPKETSGSVLDDYEESYSNENVPAEQQKKYESNILDDYEKRAEAETYILTRKGRLSKRRIQKDKQCCIMTLNHYLHMWTMS